MSKKSKDVFSAYEARLDACMGDPRELATKAAMGLLGQVDSEALIKHDYTYRLEEKASGDPRVLATIAAKGRLA